MTPCKIDPTIPLDRKGYPQRSRVVHGVRYYHEHRAVLAETLGRPVRKGFHSAHLCNNRACIEGEHLYEATPKQNAADARRAGHTPQGERNGRAKLTRALVRQIRATPRSVPSRVLAAHLGVAERTLQHVRAGDTWQEAM